MMIQMTCKLITARRYDSTTYAMALCLSVCLSVRLSQVGVLSKQLNVGSRKQRHAIAQSISFMAPKIVVKFEWDYPNVAPYTGGVRLKSAIFEQYSAAASQKQ